MSDASSKPVAPKVESDVTPDCSSDKKLPELGDAEADSNRECLPGNAHLDSGMNQICPACGTQFGCQIAAGKSSCWCFELPRVPVDSSTDGCLCPDCLGQRIADSTANDGSARQNADGA